MLLNIFKNKIQKKFFEKICHYCHSMSGSHTVSHFPGGRNWEKSATKLPQPCKPKKVLQKITLLKDSSY